MNRCKKIFSIFFLTILLYNSSFGQELKTCGSAEMLQKYFDANPLEYQAFFKENARLEAIDKEAFLNGYNNEGRFADSVYIIPVVFHILHQNGQENISDEQIKDALKCLNNDFRKLNADTINTVAAFKSIASDSRIEFRLALKDPKGNCTNGIDRIFTPLTDVPTIKDNCKINSWNRNNYLNIWVVRSFKENIAGYATFPSSSANTDGIVILSEFMGSIGSSYPNRSHTLSHEAGHYLSLFHIWGNGTVGTSCNGTDYVSDTPISRGYSSCNLSGNFCTGALENVQNIMDYSYCYTMFTKGQSFRMRSVLDPIIGSRRNLSSTVNLTTNTGVSSPGLLCFADFKALFSSSTNTICSGYNLNFSDLSWNGITNWDWSFPGGTPSFSNLQSPIVKYNSVGTYDVSLTVSNASGSKSVSKIGYVRVNTSSGTYSDASFSESFEAEDFPNTEWIINNKLPGGNSWVLTSDAASTGFRSFRINNSISDDTFLDELIAPSVDMTKIAGANPVLTFKVAHAQKATSGSGSLDKLQVDLSTNCGQNWTSRRILSGSSLSTAGVNSNWTIPSATEWVTHSINLASYSKITNLYFKFLFTSNGGNALYLDDINISGTLGLNELSNSNINFNLYPNPSENIAYISFNLFSKNNVQVRVIDLLGQEILLVFDGNLSQGQHTLSLLDNQRLVPGIYFICLSVGNDKSIKKLVIN
jgi:PKD repeat protein